MTDSLDLARREGTAPTRDEQARGFLLGVAAYGLWGLFPLYWALLVTGRRGALTARKVEAVRHQRSVSPATTGPGAES